MTDVMQKFPAKKQGKGQEKYKTLPTAGQNQNTDINMSIGI